MAKVKEQLAGACDFLEHYHKDHTDDMITRFHGNETDIYIVSDPKWRSVIAEAVKDVLPSPHGHLLKH